MTGWEQRQTREGDRYLVCLPLERAGLSHAFTLKPSVLDPRIHDARAIPPGVLQEIGLGPAAVTTLVQVHGKSVAMTDESGNAVPREADAVLIKSPGKAAIATADCVGAILYAPRVRAAAVVHAGWRGTLAGVLPEAISRLSATTGEPSSSFVLAMGPSIGGCCYEVGEDVSKPFTSAFASRDSEAVFGSRSGKTTLNLVAANAVLAGRSGLEAQRIHSAGICTSCRGDLCWSYRREGKAAGRQWTIAGL